MSNIVAHDATDDAAIRSPTRPAYFTPRKPALEASTFFVVLSCVFVLVCELTLFITDCVILPVAKDSTPVQNHGVLNAFYVISMLLELAAIGFAVVGIVSCVPKIPKHVQLYLCMIFMCGTLIAGSAQVLWDLIWDDLPSAFTACIIFAFSVFVGAVRASEMYKKQMKEERE